AQRVERVDAQPDEVRRRGDVRGVAGPAGGIETDTARGEVGAQVRGEVAGGAVVGADQEGGAGGEGAVVLEQGRQQEGPQRRRGAGLGRLPAARRAHFAGERVQALVLGGEIK